MNKIKNIKLENFTAFSKFEQTFSSGVNIIIGANGTGKIHLLKVLYAACAITSGEDKDKNIIDKLLNVFNPCEKNISRLVHNQSKGVAAMLSIECDNTKEKLKFSFGNINESGLMALFDLSEKWKQTEIKSIYIPVKEMLAHAPGFLATAAKREIAFEEVYTDIIKNAYLPKLKNQLDENKNNLSNKLEKLMTGKVTLKGEHFFIKNENTELEFTLMAEGIRKLALIWLLIKNGSLEKGTVLFWDEPEANLNPFLMGEVVEIILELQRLGVQVFLTTHNYVLLKEFDLRKKSEDEILYVSLYRDELNAIASDASNSYLEVNSNLIAATFDSLYDREIKRSLEGN